MRYILNIFRKLEWRISLWLGLAHTNHLNAVSVIDALEWLEDYAKEQKPSWRNRWTVYLSHPGILPDGFIGHSWIWWVKYKYHEQPYPDGRITQRWFADNCVEHPYCVVDLVNVPEPDEIVRNQS